MRQIARAGNMSVGSLYSYFPNKRELVLCGLRTDVLAHRCAAFHHTADYLRTTDPAAYLAAFLESTLDSILFVRPAVYAATELGSAVLWASLETALAANTREFQDALAGALTPSQARVPGLARLGRTWRRFVFGAILDREAPRQELAEGLLALLRGLALPEPVRHAGHASAALATDAGKAGASGVRYARR